MALEEGDITFSSSLSYGGELYLNLPINLGTCPIHGPLIPGQEDRLATTLSFEDGGPGQFAGPYCVKCVIALAKEHLLPVAPPPQEHKPGEEP